MDVHVGAYVPHMHGALPGSTPALTWALHDGSELFVLAFKCQHKLRSGHVLFGLLPRKLAGSGISVFGC